MGRVPTRSVAFEHVPHDLATPIESNNMDRAGKGNLQHLQSRDGGSRVEGFDRRLAPAIAVQVRRHVSRSRGVVSIFSGSLLPSTGACKALSQSSLRIFRKRGFTMNEGRHQLLSRH